MTINTVFVLGLKLFDNYIEQTRKPGFNSNLPTLSHLDHTLLCQFYRACNFHQAFERSNHSYITAYRTANYDPNNHASFLVNAIDFSSLRSEGNNMDRRSRFINRFYFDLTKDFLHGDILYTEPLENPIFYSFLMEVMTCKEMKQLALVLVFAGMMSILLGASSALAIAAATTALATVGMTATTAIVGGGITAAVGIGLGLFKPRESVSRYQVRALHELGYAEIKKNTLELPPQSMSMGSRD